MSQPRDLFQLKYVDDEIDNDCHSDASTVVEHMSERKAAASTPTLLVNQDDHEDHEDDENQEWHYENDFGKDFDGAGFDGLYQYSEARSEVYSQSSFNVGGNEDTEEDTKEDTPTESKTPTMCTQDRHLNKRVDAMIFSAVKRQNIINEELEVRKEKRMARIQARIKQRKEGRNKKTIQTAFISSPTNNTIMGQEGGERKEEKKKEEEGEEETETTVPTEVPTAVPTASPSLLGNTMQTWLDDINQRGKKKKQERTKQSTTSKKKQFQEKRKRRHHP